MWSRSERIVVYNTLFILVFPWVIVFMLPVLEKRYGEWAGTAFGLLALGGFLFYVRWLWRLFYRLNQEDSERIRRQYPGVYRVLGPPTDTNDFYRHEGVKIRVGDYGWEAVTTRRNDLIYLEGLTEDWGVLWKAGFERSKVEFVCDKPVSQYDWKDFEYAGAKPGYSNQWKDLKPVNPCPFPVTAPEGLELRFPKPY